MCSHSAGSSAWARITSSRMSFGCGLVSGSARCRRPNRRARAAGRRAPPLFREVAPVAVHVLSQQRYLAHALGRERRDLVDDLVRRAAHLAASGRGHDAVRAHAVASLRDLDPGLELALALHRQVARDVLELEEPLRGDRVARQELGEFVDLAGPKATSTNGEALEHLVLHGLRPAAAHPHDALGLFGLEALRLPEVGDEPVVGGLANRAGVEQDQVGLVAGLAFLVAQRVEHPLHALGVVLVHLAPEGCDVVAHRYSTVSVPSMPPSR